MFDQFSHYLAYGATDQQTLRDLIGKYSGIVVPGTIAAYQRRGTGGFVLSLSATDLAPPYVIDSRFPLFQQRLASPKLSHYALADLLEVGDLVETSREPAPSDFSREVLADMARSWVKFNQGYEQSEAGGFAKYARRLGRQLPVRTNVSGPEHILGLYFMADGPKDPWWDLSTLTWAATQEAAGEQARRVVAAKSTSALAALLPTIDDPEVVVWVSALDEMTAGRRDLRNYAEAIQQAAHRGMHAFALYGGFFHVLLRQFGLAGHSHGIGFGESRDWQELSQSGPPPARYYVRRAHRYFPQDLANTLATLDLSLVERPCDDCRDRLPIELDYHALMRHSVAARAEEIGTWAEVDAATAARTLHDEFEALDLSLHKDEVPAPIRDRALGYIEHLETWADALDPPPRP